MYPSGEGRGAIGWRAWDGMIARAVRRAAAPRGGGAMEIDTDRIDEAVLALLYLGLHDGCRAWKGFDWAAMDRLHGRASSPTRSARPSRWCSPRRGFARPSGCSASCSPRAA